MVVPCAFSTRPSRKTRQAKSRSFLGGQRVGLLDASGQERGGFRMVDGFVFF